MTAVKEFFDTLETRADASKTSGMTNSYLFDIEGAGQWTVKVTDGNVSVHDGLEDGADCTISASQEIFEKIIAGEQNPTSAYMTGKLKVKGDMGAAMKLQKLFLAERLSLDLVHLLQVDSRHHRRRLGRRRDDDPGLRGPHPRHRRRQASG